ncbi:hypothetical protein HYH03_003859 [Edaphochlamys debaryana]|uniref:Uncharacterized protein n=1 Tax=Edaphochlamys debaryana TaxID=47281 RepID=A0A836C2K1_9CHLO|nr:hypothetical protein HYH03_003859 [Edaphochlamys debaryana]|eukprot:KAG2498101.1 hypothetical protein HYH03_003859 [Edaphochlamys debaryana]
MDSIDMATGADVTAAERTARVLQAALSLRPPPAASTTSPHTPAPANTTAEAPSPNHPPTASAATPAAVYPPLSSCTRSDGSNPSTSGRPQTEADPGPVSTSSAGPTLRKLLLRTQAAAEALAAIGARHDAGSYSPLRRFYFSADEPLQALRLRTEQYRRQLLRAAEASGPGSREVAVLLEEVAAALSSRTVSAFLEFEGATGADSADALAASAASDWAALATLRAELEAVGRCAEAEGLPLTELLRLAEAADSGGPG